MQFWLCHRTSVVGPRSLFICLAILFMGVFTVCPACLSNAWAADLLPIPADQSWPTLAAQAGQPERLDFQLFQDVMALIRANYVEDVSKQDLFRAALQRATLTLWPLREDGILPVQECSDADEECLLNALRSLAEGCGMEPDQLLRKALDSMLHDLDPYSGLMDSAMLEELKVSTSGKFGGLGMVVGPRSGDYVVISSFDGSPAHKAGIKAGDTILAIDHIPIHGLPLPEVLRMVRGPAGSRITVATKERNSDKVKTLVLRRSLIRINPVRSAVLDGRIGYVRIVNFQETTAKDVSRAVRQIFRSVPGRPQGLVLDLRDNPGGLFDQAIKVADLFLDSGVITIIRGRKEKLNRTFEAVSSEKVPPLPIAVLINRGTASAAEILAAALTGRPAVVVIGETSFGKASVQGVFLLRNGMALRLTTAHYYTPNNLDIEGKGIEPDQRFVSPAEESDAQHAASRRTGDYEEDPLVRFAASQLLSLSATAQNPFSTLY
ncbi:MAG: S41 family peptidase [Thermodesulfobacteriota bacterium]